MEEANQSTGRIWSTHSPSRLWARISAICLVYFSLLLLLSGCASPQLAPSTRRFDFQKDTFAYQNELVWEYGYDTNGHWRAHARSPKPDYTLHCFVVARSAAQFFKFARFEPQMATVDEAVYRRLVHRVVSTNPRKHLAEAKRIVIPGYADLHSFSRDHEKLLKHECGSAVECYFLQSHWRMVLPFSRREQRHMAQQLEQSVRQDGIALVHLVRFPQLTINHGFVLFEVRELPAEIQFTAYDPNDPDKPALLSFDRKSSRFLLPANQYFPGGRVDVYQIFHRWYY